MNEIWDTEQYDVGIVGAGLAGLTAARELTGAGLDVVVLEARDRVGGRTIGGSLSTGDTIDRGAEWIGAEHDRVLELVEEFDLELCEQYGSGLDRVAVTGDVFDHGDRFQALPSESATELREAADRIESLRDGVPRETPHEVPDADAWDATTLESWKRETMETEVARQTFDAFVRAEFTVEPSEISLLYFLTAVNAAGGLEMASDSVSATQEYRLAGSTHQLSRGLAAELGDVVRLGEPVRRIDRRGDGVTLETDDGTYAVSNAVVAIPQPLVGNIDHEPPLPARRRGLGQRMPMGSVVKCIAAYEEPFWRSDGYSGSVLAADGVVSEVADGTLPNGDSGLLVAFIAGADALEWSDRPVSERRERVLAELERYVGPKAADPLEYVDEPWSTTRWSTGGYNAVMTPGTLTSCGAVLREPVDGVYWAGSETALEGRGFMEGAIRSGERVAVEIRE
ncbi:flavin monoamine oxidase family protein [Natronobacterium gregoryi]|uniref:Amine oxidase n=2 Tax=Natronobacterium gregoryi TaxID=44930 RepID=L0AG31_NATGS|nr:FAD-dependent oxidoreductase [Natronobacterium gregoryi]AFZ72030.1 monoamine oxidase [Natronobacterium gregoryi SP2]ELY62696.1 amine oxidase [Natronobacterium gregoryi SP2]PLK20878.1 FAD-dependent oxidoreductase [Natronobacterium gregoryi SP2]SFJ20299.1 monoamine oxidase [Natronobacterium gregoryi]